MTPNRTGGSQSTSCIVPAGKKMNALLVQSYVAVLKNTTCIKIMCFYGAFLV